MFRATAFLLLCAACNGAPSAPQPSPTTPDPVGLEGGEAPDVKPSSPARPRPQGDPQLDLRVGEVVLSAPPRPPVKVRVQLAETALQRNKGLMFRENMPEDEGMLFLFPSERQQSFWMQNTLIPLDMFFIDANWKVVGVVENAEPLTRSPRQVRGKSQYVLEVNGGFAAKHGFGAGTQIKFNPPAEQAE